jgi:hypothetical protein
VLLPTPSSARENLSSYPNHKVIVVVVMMMVMMIMMMKTGDL